MTTAESVATREQREMFRTLGCAEMQGYLFSPAAAAIIQLFFSDRPAAVA
jgi:EAL domain-containing protein (putative c-di-GMP-specific phosphodiesterase class I)